MSKAYYSSSIKSFLVTSDDEIRGKLNAIPDFARDIEQGVAWDKEIAILKDVFLLHPEWANGIAVGCDPIGRKC